MVITCVILAIVDFDGFKGSVMITFQQLMGGKAMPPTWMLKYYIGAYLLIGTAVYFIVDHI